MRFLGAAGSIAGVQVLRLSRATTSHCVEGFGIHVLNAPFDGTHPATKSIAVSGNTLQGA